MQELEEAWPDGYFKRTRYHLDRGFERVAETFVGYCYTHGTSRWATRHDYYWCTDSWWCVHGFLPRPFQCT